jgi:hypothetical protein
MVVSIRAHQKTGRRYSTCGQPPSPTNGQPIAKPTRPAAAGAIST